MKSLKELKEFKSKEGFTIIKGRMKQTGESCYVLKDGDKPLFAAKRRSLEETENERRENEMFRLCGYFRTKKNNTFLYWRDEETDEDFFTKVEKVCKN